MTIANQTALMIACGLAGGAVAFGIDKFDGHGPATWFPTLALGALAAIMLGVSLR